MFKLIKENFWYSTAYQPSYPQLRQKNFSIISIHDLPRSERCETALTDKNITTVAQSIFHSPKKSIQNTSAEFDISSSLKSLKLKAYHSQLLQSLIDDDFDRYIEFSDCNQL